jgi:hypothetical protein
MKTMDEIRADISAFADDEHDVIVESSGATLFVRGGKTIQCRFFQGEDGTWRVEVEDTIVSYRKFLAHHLAQLEILAQRLVAKRPAPTIFINCDARLESVSGDRRTADALELLNLECSNTPPFASRIVFITADAGHGKTWLLREYQAKQSQRFLDGQSPFVFWHVDLQGRQLLRLSEAVMGDLGDLRVSGVWMASVVRLLRHKLIVLAIDGFDELAAEQGDKDALGALALLVREMGDSGTVVAASRRTFFDSEEYIKRSRLFRSSAAGACEFDEIRLLPWARREGVGLLRDTRDDGRGFPDPEGTYNDILLQVGGETSHPIVTTPFLLSSVVSGLLRYGETPAEFLTPAQSMEAVDKVVRSFVEREVALKWKSRETGEPYLTQEQHFELLENVADEMWTGQTSRLPVDAVELVSTLLLDKWGIPEERKRQVLSMVKMHVLLTIPPGSEGDQRSFHHPEFRDFFVAAALSGHIRDAVASGRTDKLGRFLSVGPLPDAVARYVCASINDKGFDHQSVVRVLSELVDREWRPTYLQANVGTLLPSLLSGHDNDRVVQVTAKVVYSSVVFERTRLVNVEFRGGSFVRTTFRDVDWTNVRFVNCSLAEAGFARESRFVGVVLEDCQLSGVRICEQGEEVEREYSPIRMAELLSSVGIRVVENAQPAPAAVAIPPATGEFSRLVHRVLKTFRRTTILSEPLVETRFHADHAAVFDDVIPLMLKHRILRHVPGKGAGKAKCWALEWSLEDVLRADGGEGERSQLDFWADVNRRR